MSRMQKFAWFNLAVIALTTGLVFALLPFLGQRSMGGLGVLGLLGIGPVFFYKKKGEIITDERDHLIQWRSWIIAYALFWVTFVVAAVFITPLIYGMDGSVPVAIVQISVFWAMMIVYALASIAILIQYRTGGADVR